MGREPIYRDESQSATGVAGQGRASPGELPRAVGQYEIVRLIGRGGMGVVCEAMHCRLRRRVAIKFLSPSRWKDAQAIRRFDREIEAIGQLQHPNIVQAFDANESDGIHYLAMEYVDGPNVEAAVGRSLPRLSDACEIIRQAAVGLSHAHAMGLIHRDIKPSNLLLAPSGQVKIADLGLARETENLADDSSLTETGQVVGTIDYLAPELGLAPRTIDARADVYGLGCTLYRFLQGRPPFCTVDYDTTLKKLTGHAQDAPPPLSRADVPAELLSLLARMLAKCPANRPTAVELATEISPWCQGADLAALATVGKSSPDSRTAPTHSLISTRDDRRTATNTQKTAGPTAWLRDRGRWLTGGVGLICLALATVGWQLWRQHNRTTGEQLADSALTPDTDLDPAGIEIEDGGSAQVATAGGEERGVSKLAQAAPALFEDLPAEFVKPRTWYPLLNREPAALAWPSGPLSLRFFNTEEKLLNVNCRSLGMLQLGNASQADGYTFQVDVYQNPWNGGFGIFFGWHEQIIDNTPCHRYQVIDLRPSPVDASNPSPLSLWRSIVTIKHKEGGDAELCTALTSIRVPLPERDEQLLEIRVSAGRLSRLRWGGQDVEELCKPEYNRQVLPGDYVGAFGTYNNGGEATYRNARFQAF